MKNSEMAATLREFANKIGATEVEMDLHVDLATYGHSGGNMDVLRAIVKLMDGNWRHDSEGSHCWIRCKQGDADVIAHYPAGLLGKKKTVTRQVVEESEETDLSILGIG